MRYKYVNQRDHYDIVDTAADGDGVVSHEPDMSSAYRVVAALNTKFQKEQPTHHIGFNTQRVGGSMIAGGGNFRESEVHCSCGWEQTDNGQTYAESVQAAREHLKEMDVYTTPLEQTVYAHINLKNVTVMQIAAASQKTIGRVQKVLTMLVARGNVEEYEPGLYRQTDKWFSWND